MSIVFWILDSFPAIRNHYNINKEGRYKTTIDISLIHIKAMVYELIFSHKEAAYGQDDKHSCIDAKVLNHFIIVKDQPHTNIR